MIIEIQRLCEITKIRVTVLTVCKNKNNKEDIIFFNLFSVDGQDGHPSLADCSKYGKTVSKNVRPEDQRPRDPRPEDQRPRDPRPEDQRPEGG